MTIDFDLSLTAYLSTKAADFGHLIDLPTFMLGVRPTEDAALDASPRHTAHAVSDGKSKQT